MSPFEARDVILNGAPSLDLSSDPPIGPAALNQLTHRKRIISPAGGLLIYKDSAPRSRR